MATSYGSLSTRKSTTRSTVRLPTRTRTAALTSRTASPTLSGAISESSGVAPMRTSSQPATTSTGGPEPAQSSGTSQLTVGLAVGIGFVLLAILSILLLFCLRRRKGGQKRCVPSIHTPIQSLHEPNPDENEKRLSVNVRYSGYSNTPLSTVDEESEDGHSISHSQVKQDRSKTVLSMLGRFTWPSQAPDRQTGAMNDRSERRTRPPPVSRDRLERQPGR